MVADSAKRKSRRAARAWEIEVVALRLFAKHGFSNVSIQDVANEVGVHSRTVLRYFDSKEDLLLSHPRRAVEQFCQDIKERPIRESLVGAACQALLGASEALPKDAELMVMWVDAVSTYPPALSRVTGENLVTLTNAIAGHGARLPQANAAALTIAGAIAGAMHGLWRQWIDEGAEGNAAESICAGLSALDSITSPTRIAMAAQISDLTSRLEQLEIDREIFRRAAAKALDVPLPQDS